MTIKTLFVANRGEIAVRIIRAAQALGMRTIQAHSEADADMLAVRMADQAICVGPAPATQSYLDGDRIIKEALATGADAIHPGYGFLSENAEFARNVEASGLIFVGPPADTIEQMGDKAAARAAAMNVGVPVVPGSKGRVADAEAALNVAEEIGYPVMIKAAAGGGGRGIRIAQTADELASLSAQARAEAQAAFGDGGLYLEKVIVAPRHIEVQILGDGERAVHCFERECSLQRRRQKVWEEAPAISLGEKTREAICNSAVRLAESVQYRGAGTVEYLYDAMTDKFYFIEMNTRIQVEHPVTEAVTGIDLVVEMIRIAGGEKLRLAQSEICLSGHAIEVRINAEDPFRNFMPFPGKLSDIVVPEGENIRFDHFLYNDYRIPPYYDSLLGKLIVKSPTRPEAINEMAEALSVLKLEGLKTTIPLHIALCADDEVRAARFHTQWLESWLETMNFGT